MSDFDNGYDEGYRAGMQKMREVGQTRIEELEAQLSRWEKAAEKGSIYTSAELDAAVAAALEEAINRVNGCDRVSEVQPAIRALIAEYGKKNDD